MPNENTVETDYQTVKTALVSALAFWPHLSQPQKREINAALAALERIRALREALEAELEQTYDQDEQLRADLAEALEALKLARTFVNGDSPSYGVYSAIYTVLSKHAARAQAASPANATEPDPQFVQPPKKENL